MQKTSIFTLSKLVRGINTDIKTNKQYETLFIKPYKLINITCVSKEFHKIGF
jgi:hypothetical protein